MATVAELETVVNDLTGRVAYLEEFVTELESYLEPRKAIPLELDEPKQEGK